MSPLNAVTARISLKILFASKSSPIHGGVERWLAELCSGLSNRGWEITLALADGPVFHESSKYIDTYPELSSVNTAVVSSRSGLAWSRRRALERLIRKCKPDLVIPVLLHEAIGATARCRENQKIKLIYPLHESQVWAFNAVVDNTNHIDAVVTVDRLMSKAFEVFCGWPKTRLFHIPAGVAKASVSEKEWEVDTPLRIGYCGKLMQDQKRVLDLIGFCGEMDLHGVPYELIIAGDGGAKARLHAGLNSQLAKGRVRFLGGMPRTDLYQQFYPILDVLLITSDWETGPLVAWEAMMHGVLIVTTAYRGLRSEAVLRHQDTALIFPVGKPVVAADQIISALARPDEIRAIVRRARTLAEKYLTTNNMIENWSNMLLDVLELPALAHVNKNSCYDYRISYLEKLEDAVRTLLGRPFRSANSHQEWPRYRAVISPGESAIDFTRRLDKLEGGLVGNMNSSGEALCNSRHVG